MKCYDLETLSRYQDGALDERQSHAIRDHLMGCDSCQEKMRSLGRAGLFLRIALAGRRHTECPTAEELGAYLSGRMSLVDRRRIEGHLVMCPRCLHETAVLSDVEMQRRSSGSPVPDAAALERFRRLAARRSPARPTLQLVGSWGLRAAAAVLLVFMTVGRTWTPRVVEAPLPGEGTTISELQPLGDIGEAGVVTEVSLTSDGTLLQPDTTDLAVFAHEVSIVLRDIERIAQAPRIDSLELVQEDILNSALVDSVARLKELTVNRREHRFLSDCEYLLMLVVKAKGEDLERELTALASEIRRLNLVETARLVAMERGEAQWPFADL